MALSLTQLVQHFNVALSLGAIRNTNGRSYEAVRIYGRNTAVSSGNGNLISSLGSVNNSFNQTTASTVRIAAGGSSDDDAAGIGAREITVFGIDNNFQRVSEAIATAGASASSATTTEFRRVFRAVVTKAGSYAGLNLGNVIVERTDSGADIIQIDNRNQESHFGGYTVPVNYTALLRYAHFLSASTNSTQFRLRVKTGADKSAAPYDPLLRTIETPYLAGGSYRMDFENPLVIPEKSDVYFEGATVSAVTNSVQVEAGLILIPNY